MNIPHEKDVTRLIAAAAKGDPDAALQLLPLLYTELRQLARRRMAKLPPGQTLQPTALVHEVYVRLLEREDKQWEHRGHVMACAALAMRDILVDNARRRAAQKRGGDRQRVALDGAEPEFEVPHVDVLAVHEALERLEAEDPRKRDLINLRFFAGLSNAETAAALGVSVGTVERDWRYVRAWLKTQIGKSD